MIDNASDQLFELGDPAIADQSGCDGAPRAIAREPTARWAMGDWR